MSKQKPDMDSLSWSVPTSYLFPYYYFFLNTGNIHTSGVCDVGIMYFIYLFIYYDNLLIAFGLKIGEEEKKKGSKEHLRF